MRQRNKGNDTLALGITAWNSTVLLNDGYNMKKATGFCVFLFLFELVLPSYARAYYNYAELLETQVKLMETLGRMKKYTAYQNEYIIKEFVIPQQNQIKAEMAEALRSIRDLQKIHYSSIRAREIELIQDMAVRLQEAIDSIQNPFLEITPIPVWNTPKM